MKLLIASKNEEKIRWFKKAFDCLPEDIEVITLDDIGYTPRVDECGSSYEINAIIKAIEPTTIYPEIITVADDGGLVLKATDTIGGLYSHRHNRDLCKDILDFLTPRDSDIKPRDRVCKFERSCAVAWHDTHNKIQFRTIRSCSPERLEITQIDLNDIPAKTHCFDIIERVFENQRIKPSDMEELLLMNSVGALDPYMRLAWMIQNYIMNCISK